MPKRTYKRQTMSCIKSIAILHGMGISEGKKLRRRKRTLIGRLSRPC